MILFQAIVNTDKKQETGFPWLTNEFVVLFYFKETSGYENYILMNEFLLKILKVKEFQSPITHY